ncbi:MAG: hypothetical protein E6R13_07840 [Spirochaetes bacterium]|nr:MAG: hypothetical protein E6R13_07840 [Spirochaetota bacterium]
MAEKRKYSENVHKFRTPSLALNAITAGGIKFCSISEFWGRFKCFTGDMRVRLSDGTNPTFKELSEKNEEFEVFAYDIKTGIVKPKKARFAGMHRAKKLAHVHLNCNFMVKCTVDHKFLLENDTWVEAQDLKNGDAISTVYDLSKLLKSRNTTVPVRVIKLDIVDADEDVYDINVDDFNNFSVEVSSGVGIVVHNSGKTTATYEMAQAALNDYGEDARVVIIDSECSSDATRLSNFNLFPSNGEIEMLEEDPRVFLHYIATIEEAIDTCLRYAAEAKKNGTPTLIIVDSISTLKPKNEVEELNKFLDSGKEGNKYSQGMMLSPRIMTSKLTDLLNKLPNSNTSVILINQATVDLDSTYIKRDKAKGGNAKNHAIHYSLHFNFVTNKADEREEKSFTSDTTASDQTIKGLTMTTLSMDKNKFGISEGSIKLIINNADDGGKFVPAAELITWALSKEILISKGAYLQLIPEFAESYKTDTLDLTKNWRYKEIAENKEYIDILEKIMVDYYRKTSKSVDLLYKTKEAYIKKFGYKETILNEFKHLLPENIILE